MYKFVAHVHDIVISMILHDKNNKTDIVNILYILYEGVDNCTEVSILLVY